MVLLSWITASFALATIIFCLSFPSLSKKQNTKTSLTEKSLPEAGGGWPLFGHLFLLAGSGADLLHVSLSKMADKHGPIFAIRVGPRRGLVVSTWEAAKECYKTNDATFSTRPRTAAIAHMGYNFAMFGFSDYGPYWREIRKIATQRLLSNRKVDALSPGIQAQIQSRMKLLNEYCCCSSSSTGEEAAAAPIVNLSKVFGDMVIGLMAKTVAGNVEKGGMMDSEKNEEWRGNAREFLKMMNVFTVSDVVPYLKWMDYLGGMHRGFKRTGRNLDRMLQAWLDEHKKLKKEAAGRGGSSDEEEEEDDFMMEMLRVSDGVAHKFPVYDADTINKSTCQTLMVGGVDTATVTLTWAMSYLLNNRQALIKAQEELDKHVGRERLVKESDVENLVYIQAVLKETLRIQPTIPITIREAAQDCIVAGYHIPAGTRLFVNTWKIQRDPRLWDDPLEFKPERFLKSNDHDGDRDRDGDGLGLEYGLVPFGGGRRGCPGVYLALRTTQLALASILHGFDIETASGAAVDMEGSFGTANMKATPLELHRMEILKIPYISATPNISLMKSSSSWTLVPWIIVDDRNKQQSRKQPAATRVLPLFFLN